MKKTTKGSSLYPKTKYPKLYCPDCKTHLTISNLQQRLWCSECYDYIPQNKLMEGFVRGLE